MKRKHLIRDMYDGKIIKDKEAIRKENIEMAIEKEGLKNIKHFTIMILFLLMFISFIDIVNAQAVNNNLEILISSPDNVARYSMFTIYAQQLDNNVTTCYYYVYSYNGTLYDSGNMTLINPDGIFSANISNTTKIETLNIIVKCTNTNPADFFTSNHNVNIYRAVIPSAKGLNVAFDLKDKYSWYILILLIIIGVILSFTQFDVIGEVILVYSSFVLILNLLWPFGILLLGFSVMLITKPPQQAGKGGR